MDSDDVWRQKWVDRWLNTWTHPLVQSVVRRRKLGVEREEEEEEEVGLPLVKGVGGWKRFYSVWECEWVEWLCAGYNREEGCLVGLGGSVYDVTSFLEFHPGSKVMRSTHPPTHRLQQLIQSASDLLFPTHPPIQSMQLIPTAVFSSIFLSPTHPPSTGNHPHQRRQRRHCFFRGRGSFSPSPCPHG